MLSATLKKGLGDYRIGERLRALRLKKKMGLVELGKHTGLSPALLSKLERGRLFPTLPTLLRIALVFSVGLEFFFAGARDKPLVAIVRRKERVQLPERPGPGAVMYRFESLDFAPPSGGSIPISRNSCPPPRRSSARMRIPAWNSFLSCMDPSACTSERMNTSWMPAIPCTSTAACPTHIAGRPAAPVPPVVRLGRPRERRPSAGASVAICARVWLWPDDAQAPHRRDE